MKKTLLPLLLLGGLSSFAQSNHFTFFKKTTPPTRYSQLLNNLLSHQSQTGNTAQKPTGTKQRVIAQTVISAESTSPDDTTRYTYSGTRGSIYSHNQTIDPLYNEYFTSDFITGPYGAAVSTSANLLADSIITYYEGATSSVSNAFYRTDNKLDSFFQYYNIFAPTVTYKTQQSFNANGTMSHFEILDNSLNPPDMDTNMLRKFWYNTAGTQLETDTLYSEETNGLEPYSATKYHYNTSNNLDSIQEFEYDGSGYTLYALLTIKYDANNRITNFKHFDYSDIAPIITTDTIAYTGSLPFFTFYQSTEVDPTGNYIRTLIKTIGTNNLPDTVKFYALESGGDVDTSISKYYYNSFNNPDSLISTLPDGTYLGRISFYYETYNDSIPLPIAIKDVDNNKNFSIYPNPFDNKINIDWKGKATGKTKISLVNIVGQNIFSATKNLVSGNNSIDLPVITSGQYVLLIQDEQGNTWSQKLIKK